MPRIPRLRRGEGDGDRAEQPTQALTPGDPADGAAAPPPASTSAVVPAPAAAGEAAAPADTDADAAPRFRARTRMRRRLRELRRLREVAFRDLGGLMFDLHRFGRDRDDLVAAKLEALARIDHELRTIERALDEQRDVLELREPGIAACPRCATLHGTDANFCPGCGTPLRGSASREEAPPGAPPAQAKPHAEQPAAPAPS